MSVDAYLGKNQPKQRRYDWDAVEDGEAAPISCGVRLGHKACCPVPLQTMLWEMTEPEFARRRRVAEEGEDFYDTVEMYDPVLLSHCRLK